ncbi:unnamed protein product [Thelazia callipaeda]|uniref:Rab3 GTPase-activating protein catalytic subunit n=1 Tax=Thelazia callipaeda TaxID=103827 RepID=A0A0N5CVT7_THECL|nr:unnamed protein product [Thelazia callipaeda]
MALSNSEKYDEDVFEIEDFTIVTIKEGLCAELEQLLRKWELVGDIGNNYSFTKTSLAECQWDSKYQEITYGNNHLLVTHYWPKNLKKLEQTEKPDESTENYLDSFLCNAARLVYSSETDFCPGSIICNQFGVLEFIILTPSNWLVDKVSNEDQLRGLLSYGESERQLYFGVCQNNSMRTNFESVHLRQGHPLRCHLSGCIDIFKETLNSSLMDDRNLRSSVQFDYVLQDKFHHGNVDKKISLEEMAPAEDVGIVDTSHLPFGAASDAIEEFGLSAIWLNVERGVVIEEQNVSNLDPRGALSWSSWVLIRKTTTYLMSSCLRKLLEIAQSEEGSGLIMKVSEHTNQDATRALSSLLFPATPQSISIESTKRMPSQVQLKSDVIQQLLDMVFKNTQQISMSKDMPSHNEFFDLTYSEEKRPTSAPGGAVKNESKLSDKCIMEDEDTKDIYQKLHDMLMTCKAAPEGSLTCRISIALAKMLSVQNYAPTNFPQIWSAITRELQNYYDANLPVPGIDESSLPNLSTCKLHQNFQLLQCAIEAKKGWESRNQVRREECNRFESDKLNVSNVGIVKDDEFFDAPEFFDKNDSKNLESPDSWISQGRLRPFGEMKLLNFPDRIMYEPITQSRMPVTEDMLDKYTEYLSSLKDQEERVKAQLEPLFSDMEAFKAANPGCSFEDFVRWHSPRDFVVDGNHLSHRMIGDDNTWQQTWNQAQPKPVCRQKMLFNYSKAANEIINDFESLTLSKLIIYILPVLVKSASMQLIEESKYYFALVGDKLFALCRKVLDCTINGSIENYWSVVKDVTEIEKLVSCCNILYTQLIFAVDKKLTENEKYEIRQFIMSLMRLSELDCESMTSGGKAGAGYRIPVNGGLCGPVGLALKNLFFGKRTFEQILSGDEEVPYRRRQYTIRCSARKPTLGSRTLPQRLYAAISREEYRICLALSSDTVLS